MLFLIIFDHGCSMDFSIHQLYSVFPLTGISFRSDLLSEHVVRLEC